MLNYSPFKDQVCVYTGYMAICTNPQQVLRYYLLKVEEVKMNSYYVKIRGIYLSLAHLHELQPSYNSFYIYVCGSD